MQNLLNILRGLFKSLPSSIYDGKLTLIFKEDAETLAVSYVNELWNTVTIREVSLERYGNLENMMVISDLLKTYENDIGEIVDPLDVDKCGAELENIARDILLLFSVLPPHVFDGRDGFSFQVRQGRKFSLRVLVSIKDDVPNLSVCYMDEHGSTKFVDLAKDGPSENLTPDDIERGMKKEFGLNIFMEPNFVNAQPQFKVRFESDQPLYMMGRALGISIQRVTDLMRIMNKFSDENQPMNEEKLKRGYEELTSHCRNANELFYIGWASGQSVEDRLAILK